MYSLQDKKKRKEDRSRYRKEEDKIKERGETKKSENIKKYYKR